MNSSSRFQFLSHMLSNGNKWPMLNSIYCSVLLFILIILFHRNLRIEYSISKNDISNNFTFKLNMEEGGQMFFYLNESSSDLYKICIEQSGFIYNYNVFDMYEVSKALKECFSGDICKDKLKIHSESFHRCVYYSHVYLVKFCFDMTQRLTNVILFDQVVLSPYDVRRFMIIIRQFLKV